MGLEQLWAGWRSDYINGVVSGDHDDAGEGSDGSGGDACVFCRILSSSLPAEETGIVWRGGRIVALLNAYPYATGHLMVMPERHVGGLDDLATEESAELWQAVTTAVDALRAAYSPDGVNIGANLGRAAGAGIPGHLHLHVVPRWLGDTNFMTSVAGVRVMPEALDVSWRKLSSAWPVG